MKKTAGLKIGVLAVCLGVAGCMKPAPFRSEPGSEASAHASKIIQIKWESGHVENSREIAAERSLLLEDAIFSIPELRSKMLEFKTVEIFRTGKLYILPIEAGKLYSEPFLLYPGDLINMKQGNKSSDSRSVW